MERDVTRAPSGEVASLDRPGPSALFLAFLRLGATAFGGPAMVAHIGVLANRRKWTSQSEYADGVALCQSIPGATAMQAAAFVGLRAGEVRGGARGLCGVRPAGGPAYALGLGRVWPSEMG